MPYLSAVVLVATIATLVLAVLSYAAFKLRGRRKPLATAARPVYFRRVRLDEPGEPPREASRS